MYFYWPIWGGSFQFPGAFPPISRFLFGLTTRSLLVCDSFLHNLEIVGWFGKAVSCNSLKASSARSFWDISSPTFCQRSNSLTMACLWAFVKWQRRVDCELPLITVGMICVSTAGFWLIPQLGLFREFFYLYDSFVSKCEELCLFTVAAGVHNVGPECIL